MLAIPNSPQESVNRPGNVLTLPFEAMNRHARSGSYCIRYIIIRILVLFNFWTGNSTVIKAVFK